MTHICYKSMAINMKYIQNKLLPTRTFVTWPNFLWQYWSLIVPIGHACANEDDSSKTSLFWLWLRSTCISLHLWLSVIVSCHDHHEMLYERQHYNISVPTIWYYCVYCVFLQISSTRFIMKRQMNLFRSSINTNAPLLYR